MKLGRLIKILIESLKSDYDKVNFSDSDKIENKKYSIDNKLKFLSKTLTKHFKVNKNEIKSINS